MGLFAIGGRLRVCLIALLLGIESTHWPGSHSSLVKYLRTFDPKHSVDRLLLRLGNRVYVLISAAVLREHRLMLLCRLDSHMALALG